MTLDYIHGFSIAEQRRLIRQAEVLATEVFRGIDIGGDERVLELGCGVGAELIQLRQRWPATRLTGLERSATQLAAARGLLEPAIDAAKVRLVRGDARALPFATASFDRVLTVWLLEHVDDPGRVLAEAARVLTDTGRLVCIEVDNGSLAFEPEMPAIDDWWRRFNQAQASGGGDPLVGRRLARLAGALGLRDIRTETLPVIWSERSPQRRELLVDYLGELLLSGADRMAGSGLAAPEHVRALRSELARVRRDPDVSFRYFAVRLTCRPPLRGCESCAASDGASPLPR